MSATWLFSVFFLAGMLEKVAKWMLDEQRLFLDKLLERRPKAFIQKG